MSDPAVWVAITVVALASIGNSAAMIIHLGQHRRENRERQERRDFPGMYE